MVLTFLGGFTFRPLLFDLIFPLIFLKKYPIYEHFSLRGFFFFSYHNSQWPILLRSMNFWKADKNPRLILSALRERKKSSYLTDAANVLSVSRLQEERDDFGWSRRKLSQRMKKWFLPLSSDDKYRDTCFQHMIPGFLICQGFICHALSTVAEIKSSAVG